MFVTVPDVISTLLVSFLKPPPKYNFVEPIEGLMCSSWHHVSPRKARSRSLLKETDKTVLSPQIVYMVLTYHTSIVELMASSWARCISLSESV